MISTYQTKTLDLLSVHYVRESHQILMLKRALCHRVTSDTHAEKLTIFWVCCWCGN